MEDEDEYVDFYDFSKTYENHPLLIQGENEEEPGFEAITEEPEKENKKTKKGEDGDDSWDDCELEEADMKSNHDK
jgi:hypothetical protein